MPTKEALVRCTIIQDSLYDCCQETHETPLHALWLCKELDTVWERSAHCQVRRETNFLNFKELLSWILTQTSEVELFAMIAWGMWNQCNQAELALPHAQSTWGSRGERIRAARLAAYCNYLSKKKKCNQARLNHVATPLHQIFQISIEKLANFTTCQPSATPMMVRRVNPRTRWQPPPADLMKLILTELFFLVLMR